MTGCTMNPKRNLFKAIAIGLSLLVIAADVADARGGRGGGGGGRGGGGRR